MHTGYVFQVLTSKYIGTSMYKNGAELWFRLHYLEKYPPEVFCKTLFLKISQYLQEKTCVGVSF